MQVTARVDYAVRALLELAAADGAIVTRDELSDAQTIPPRYLEVVLSRLRLSGIIRGQRGAAGGYLLAKPAADITVADVVRSVDGPLSLVQGQRPEDVHYEGHSEHVGSLWIAVRASVRTVMESTTIADLLSGELPAEVQELVALPDAWQAR